MDKALKIGKLIAYAAEIILATFMVADTIESISERKASRKTNANGNTAEEAVPESINN